MLVLLVVLWLLGVLARDDASKDRKYQIIKIHSCPSVGYFFSQQTSPNVLEAVCHLCFCQGDGTAVCWQRENRKCDAQHYQHRVKKRIEDKSHKGDTRVRRSPIGFSDIFFRDATRDLFNKQMPETCKPYESSFSEGCPPKDWCVGCTVCDCDANGRWDCHVLSFCPDKKDKTKLKTTKKRVKDGSPKRTTVRTTPTRTIKKTQPKKTSALKKTTTNSKKQSTNKPQKIARVNKPVTKQQRKPTNNKNQKKIYYVKPKTNNSTLRKGNASPKPLIMKKDVKKNTPIYVKNSQLQQLSMNDTEKITREVYSHVFTAMQKFLDKRISAIAPNRHTVNTPPPKRAMVKRSTKNIKNTKNGKKKSNGPYKPVANQKKYSKPVWPKNKKQIINKNSKQANKEYNKATKGKRSKREVNDDNITQAIVIENNSYTNMDPAVIPLSVVAHSSFADNETVSNVTETNTYYRYEYSMLASMVPNVTVIPNDNQAVFPSAKNISKSNATHAVQAKKVRDDAEPEFNDLKFNNWPQVKLLKNSLVKLHTFNITLGNNATNLTNFTTTTSTTKEMPEYPKTKLVPRIVSLHSKKFNKTKIVSTISCNTHSNSKRISGNLSPQNKIYNLQNVLNKVLDGFRNNSTAKVKFAPRRFNVIKYMNKFLKKLFNKAKKKDESNNKNQFNLNSHIIDTICEHFKDCDKSKKNSLILRYKLRELNKQSDSIIRTIKIIKGLLHLFQVPSDDKLIDERKQKADIYKLSAVLKDKYANSNTPLTSTQMTQIRYIKNNTHEFVQSVSKFANTLSEIITILTKNHNHNIGNKHASKTVKRSSENNTKVINETEFKRLKDLLVQYNFIQNTFVRKMYDLVTKFEMYDKNTRARENDENNIQTAKIGRLSRNIINNLRKLKSLAQRLNTRRQKRHVMRDDYAMEYLLTLMEYLLKKNYPLDAAPVNDGIDLLIEAIKSAPDIKPIKIKVLQAIPAKIRVTRTTEPVPSNFLENSISDSKKVSDDSAYNDTESDNEDHGTYQDKKKVFKYQPGKDIFDITDAAWTDVYYEKVETTTNGVPFDETDTTLRQGAHGAFRNEDRTEYSTFDNFENLAKATRKHFDIFSGDLDEEEVETVTVSAATRTAMPTILETEADTTTAPLATTELKLASMKSKQYNSNDIDISGNSESEKRVTLDWLDEGYDEGKEVRQTKNVSVTRTESPVIVPTPVVRSVDNVSTLSKETKDEDLKRRAKININDVMFKKQMDLLNSLDYGTEKIDSEDAGDERDSADAFPSYFV